MLTAEHRQSERIPVVLEAKYRDKNSSFKPYNQAELTDIHHHGCRIMGGVNFKRGDPVSILVDLPQDGPLHMEGVAAWSSSIYKNRLFETGVHFQSDDPADQNTYLKLFHFCLLNRNKKQ